MRVLEPSSTESPKTDQQEHNAMLEPAKHLQTNAKALSDFIDTISVNMQTLSCIAVSKFAVVNMDYIALSPCLQHKENSIQFSI